MLLLVSGIIRGMLRGFQESETYESPDMYEWLVVLKDTLLQLPVTNEDYASERRALEQAIAELHGIIEHYERSCADFATSSLPPLGSAEYFRQHN